MVKNPPAKARDVRDAGSITGLGRSLGRQHGNPLQCSCLENPTDREAWQATVHRVTQSQTRLKQLSTAQQSGIIACISVLEPASMAHPNSMLNYFMLIPTDHPWWEYLRHTAVATAKSLQSYPTVCDPIDSSLPGSPVPGILQARTLEWAAVSFSNA